MKVTIFGPNLNSRDESRVACGDKSACEYGCCFDAHRADKLGGHPASKHARASYKRRLRRIEKRNWKNPKNW